MQQQIPSDTDPRVEKLLLEGYRRMTPSQKLERVASLNRALDELAKARIRATYGSHLSSRELLLRLGALRLGRATMIRVFNWDPEEHGY